MIKRFEDFDFAQGGDGHSFFLVMHQDALQGNHFLRALLQCLVHLTVKPSISLYVAEEP